ncbi:MAG: hypothetical protein HKN91_02725 [Acidimicrobiia bacterium]|nr:hypothetical protein [Acidimicrobiia bacterium]
MSIDERIQEALRAGSAAVTDSGDLFERVQLSIADDRLLRQQRQRRTGVVLCIAAAAGSIAAATTNRRQGDLIMDWWILELIWFAGMVGLALWLGPFIRRFGKAYAADVFRANPRTGKSFIVLMDVAYYLIFFAYILFAVKFEPDSGWENTVNANQLQASTVRLGGILLIVGLLHGLNVLTLPIMGRIFTLNRRLDDDPVDMATK